MADKQMTDGSDDQMVELTERARLISRDAGTKVTSAMREMIGAAAGIAGFAVESARDMVQYMVRRGQMTQEEAEKLIREAEAIHNKKPKAERDRIAAERLAAEKRAAEKKAAMLAAETAPPVHRPVTPGRLLAQGAGKSVKQPPPAKGAEAPKLAEKPAAKMAEKSAPKMAEKSPARSAEKPMAMAMAKTAAKGSEKPGKAPMKAAAKVAAKPAAKPAAKTPAKAAAKKPAAKAPAKAAAKKATKKKR